MVRSLYNSAIVILLGLDSFRLQSRFNFKKCRICTVLILIVIMHLIYRVIHSSLRDFRPPRYSSRDGYAKGEHVNRRRDTPSFCPTLQVLDISTVGDAADFKPIIKFLPHTCNVCARNLITGLTSAASPRVEISSTCR